MLAHKASCSPLSIFPSYCDVAQARRYFASSILHGSQGDFTAQVTIVSFVYFSFVCFRPLSLCILTFSVFSENQ
jgi:hypothetical protein